MPSKVKNRRLAYLLFMLILASVLINCDKKSPSEPEEKNSICFTVDGFDVTVHNFWSGGGSYTVDCQGLTGFKETTSMNNETHTSEWTNIRNNYGTRTVDSFNVTIDGKAYSYPRDKCN